MLAVDPMSEELGDPEALVDRHAGQLLAVPGVGLPEALGAVPEGFDEPRHPISIIPGPRPWDQRAFSWARPLGETARAVATTTSSSRP